MGPPRGVHQQDLNIKLLLLPETEQNRRIKNLKLTVSTGLWSLGGNRSKNLILLISTVLQKVGILSRVTCFTLLPSELPRKAPLRRRPKRRRRPRRRQRRPR